MSDDQVDKALRMAADFDALIDRALDERQEAYGFPVFDLHPLRRHRVHEFGEAFRDGQASRSNAYPVLSRERST